MVGEKVTLNELIQVANKKVGTDKEALAQLAADEGFQGTSKEIITYVEENEKLFADPNMEDIKTALSNFLTKMSKDKMKMTLAAMKRELEEFKAQDQPEEEDGDGLLTQSDLDALLAQAATQNQGRQPKIVAPVKEKKEEEKEDNSDSAQDTFDQAEIDALLNSHTTGEDEPGAAEEPDVEAGVVMDQDTIDALLAGGGAPAEVPEEAAPQQDGDLEEPVQDEADAIAAENDTGPASVSDDITEAENIDGDLDQADIDALLQAQKVEQGEDGEQETNGGEVFAADEAPEEIEPLEVVDQPASPPFEVQASPPDAAQEEAAATGDATPDFISPRVLEEKGSATILKEYYRIYVRENGTFHSFFETDDKETAKQNLQQALKDFPAKNVMLGKITQKEVMVIKEDVKELPVAVQVDFGD